jgi:hypothetical protein
MPNADDHARIAALVHDYLAARYRCGCGGQWHDIAIGAPAPEVERCFATTAQFGLLSAWNPMSNRRPGSENEAADDALRAALAETGNAGCRSLASAPDGGWEEPGWLVPGLAPPALDALARRFGQLGVLHWRRGEPVRLRILRPRPAGWRGPAPVDWVE